MCKRINILNLKIFKIMMKYIIYPLYIYISYYISLYYMHYIILIDLEQFIVDSRI